MASMQALDKCAWLTVMYDLSNFVREKVFEFIDVFILVNFHSDRLL